MPTAPASKCGLISTVLVRGIVPLWILAGALFKLYEDTPQNLPSGMRTVAGAWGIDLSALLRTAIGLELFAVGVMLLVPRLARVMAVFMLTCFCAILIWEMARSATKCGCFGSLPMKPWHMLLIDGSLLVAVLACSIRWGTPQQLTPARQPLWAAGAVSLVALAVGLGVAFTYPSRSPVVQDVPEQTADPTVNPAPIPVPSTWYIKETVEADQTIPDWVGKPWRSLELFQLMPKWPTGLDQGKHYVVFYSRTCEHCQAMFTEDLSRPLDAPVAVVEIPASRTRMTAATGAWPMPWTTPPAHLELLSLPLGASYVLTPPISLRIENGIVTCAFEGDHKTCMGLR